MSAEPARRNWRWIAAAVGAAVVIGVVIAYVVSRQESASDVVVVPTQQPTPVETPGVSESPPATTPPSPSESAPPSEPPSEPAESETAAPQQAQPTDADVAAFMQAHGPADHTATGDILGDSTDEVVVASVRNNTVVIIVGMWDGDAYSPTFRDGGGPAQRVTSLSVADRNGVPGAEIVTEQRAGTEGRSISVWGPTDGDLRPQEAKGGCWDGFHTYGIAGATLADGQIIATCDGSPDPPDTWGSDVYVWRKGRWTYIRTEGPGN